MSNTRFIALCVGVVLVGAGALWALHASFASRVTSARELSRSADADKQEQALRELDHVLTSFSAKLFPDVLRAAHYERGLVYVAAGHDDWAAEEFRTAIEIALTPQRQHESMYQLGLIAFRAKDFNQARELFYRTVGSAPIYSRDELARKAIWELFRTLVRMDRVDDAASEIRGVIAVLTTQQRAEAPFALADRALVARDGKRDADMLEVARDAVEANQPEVALIALYGISSANAQSRDAMFYMGYALSLEQEYDRALVLVDKAIALDEDNALQHYVKGNVLQGLESYVEALGEYRRAEALGFVDPDLAVQMGRVQQKITK